MALQNISELGNELKDFFVQNTSWPELTFDVEDKRRIKEIPGVDTVDSHSIKFVSDNNIIYVPSQYISLAIKIKPFALELKKYTDLFEELKQSNHKNVLADFIKNEGVLTNSDLLHEEDVELLKRMFSSEDSELNFGAKSIINGTTGNYNLRSTSDFFGSVILKIINVPDVSSAKLGSLIYSLTVKPELYEYLEAKFSNIGVSPTNNNQQEVLIENGILRRIILDSFLYCLDKFGEQIMLNGYHFKETQLDGREYEGIMLPEYFGRENFIGQFQQLQTDDGLKSSGTNRFVNVPFNVLGNENSYITSQWNSPENGRGLNLSNFNRLLKDISNNTLQIVKENDIYKLIHTNTGKYYNENIIFFGAPGTGKSHEVKEIVKNVPEVNFRRVTFHPEYDYSSFVGGYKPVSVKDKASGKSDIEYRFESQVFSEMYVEAWKNKNTQYFLIIEEINRGNCAEIFGDIFQLLDRNPDYKVSPSSDLLAYLKEELGENADGIKNDKMIMPANLTLLATMNTSDQSLFPMDSAFKRRWKWEYVPIQNPLEENDNTSDSFGFIIKIDEEKEIRWIDFMVEINKHIAQPHIGMDKCLGNYFIQPDEDGNIELKDFIHKVIFYLWNDVFKDEENQIFGKDITYQSFFPVETNGKAELLKILEYLEINIRETQQKTQQLQEQEGTEE